MIQGFASAISVVFIVGAAIGSLLCIIELGTRGRYRLSQLALAIAAVTLPGGALSTTTAS